MLFHRSWKFSSKSFSISRFIIKLSSPAHSFSTAWVSVYKSHLKSSSTAHFAITKRIAKTNASKLLVGAFIWWVWGSQYEYKGEGIPTTGRMDSKAFPCIHLCQIYFLRLLVLRHGSPILSWLILKKEIWGVDPDSVLDLIHAHCSLHHPFDSYDQGRTGGEAPEERSRESC